MNVLVDLDSTCNDLWEYVFGQVKSATGITLDDSMLKYWDITRNFDEQAAKAVVSVISTPGFFYQLPIRPHCYEVLREINDHHTVLIVTALPASKLFRMKGYFEDKMSWVRDNLDFINIKKQLIFTSAKSQVRGEALIDDSAHHLRQFSGDRYAFLYPYNEGIKDVVYIDSWLDLEKYFL